MLYVVAALLFAVDQLIKWVVVHHLIPMELVPVLPPVLYFDFIRNPGGAFGILPGARSILVIVALVVILAVVYIDRKYKPGRWNRVAMGLLLGGALGNLSDRLFAGTVVDYVYFKIINFPIFNLADVSIDAGVVMLLIGTLWPERQANREIKDVSE